MRRLSLRLTGLILMVAAAVVRGDAPPAVTVAVLNFAQTEEGPAAAAHAWMRKGLADLLINDLATAPALRILTREHMQMLLQEAGLQQNLLGGVPDAEAEKMRH
ncbi:hypothetical protein GX586_03705, partial [bacterium]|nr:hypothetical protein [bacterium]